MCLLMAVIVWYPWQHWANCEPLLTSGQINTAIIKGHKQNKKLSLLHELTAARGEHPVPEGHTHQPSTGNNVSIDYKSAGRIKSTPAEI